MTVNAAKKEIIWLGKVMQTKPDHLDERHRERMQYLRTIILTDNIKQNEKRKRKSEQKN